MKDGLSKKLKLPQKPIHLDMPNIFAVSPASYSLKTRFAIASVVLFLLSVWGMAGYVAHELKHDLEYLLADQQRAMADSIAQAIGSSVRLRRESLLMHSSNIKPEILHDREALVDLLSQNRAMNQLFDVALIVTAPTGLVLAEHPPRLVQTDDRFDQGRLTRAIIERKRFSVGTPSPNHSGAQVAIPFGAPIIGKDGKLLGTFVGITSLRASEFIDETTDIKSDIGYLVVSRSSRRILAASDRRRIMQPAPRPGSNLLLDRFIGGYEGTGIAVNSRGIEELSSGKEVKGTDWIVAVTMPTENAFAPVYQMQKRIFASTAILSLVVALLTWFLVQRTMKPLELLINSVRKLGTPEAPMQQLNHEPSGPEIKDLLDAFNRMQQRIFEQAAVLTENEARFHFVADHSPMLIWISDEAGQRIWFNQTWLKTTSRSLEQVHANRWIDDIHPDDCAHYIQSVEQIMVTREPVRAKFRLRVAGDAYRWFLEIAVPRFVDGSKFAGYVGSCLDIDEQVVAQGKTDELLSGNRKLMAERFQIEEAEHRRLARDLHDDLGQWLTAISVNAEAICAIAGGEGQEKIHHCATSIITSTGAIQDFVRDMNRKLGSDTLTTLGLRESLAELILVWRKQQDDLVTELTFDDNLVPLDKHLETTVFRLVQEALTNVVRHARASRVRMDLRRQHTTGGDELLLLIMDDGIGFDVEPDCRGVGLIGMRERAVVLGGSCMISSEPNKGTSVEFRIPLGKKASSMMTGNEHADF